MFSLAYSFDHFLEAIFVSPSVIMCARYLFCGLRRFLFRPKRVSNQQIAKMALTLCGSRSKRFSIRLKWNKFHKDSLSMILVS